MSRRRGDPLGGPERGTSVTLGGPKRKGMTYIATRRCCRCKISFSHPLEPGWALELLDEDPDHHLWVCPGCSRPGDLLPDGT